MSASPTQIRTKRECGKSADVCGASIHAFFAAECAGAPGLEAQVAAAEGTEQPTNVGLRKTRTVWDANCYKYAGLSCRKSRQVPECLLPRKINLERLPFEGVRAVWPRGGQRSWQLFTVRALDVERGKQLVSASRRDKRVLRKILQGKR